MDWFKPVLEDRELLRDLIATFLVFLVVMVVRAAAVRGIQRIHWAREESRLRWRVQLRVLVVVVLAAALFLIWGAELRTFALSFVAVAVALVIATKELILCAMGSVYRLSSRAFAIGDRVEVNESHGDVVDIGLFSTRLLEVGPTFQHTGRIVTIPNSAFLSGSIINESEGGAFVIHTMRIPLAADADWRLAEVRLLQVATSVCSKYVDDARSSLITLSSQHDWEVPKNPEDTRIRPTVSVRVGQPDQLELWLRVPVPARSKGRVEQAIYRGFLDAMCEPISDQDPARSA